MSARAASHRRVVLSSVLERAGVTPQGAITCAIVGAGIVLGGGGSSAPLSELILQVIVALAAAAWLMLVRSVDQRVPPIALALAGLTLVLPLAQLIPLPPAMWQALPGRATEVAALDLVGGRAGWMPWTVSPSRTMASLLAIAPAAFVLCAASVLDRAARRALLLTIAAFGLASLLVGALQLADGVERSWRFYIDNPGYLNGFQANRNAEADVLLIAFAALACLFPPEPADRRRGASLALIAGGCAALLLGCVLTGSRAGIALALPVVILVLIAWRGRIAIRARHGWVVGGAVVLLGCLVLVQARGGALGLIAARFTGWHDVRADLWRDTLPVVWSVWPTGSGVGTFRPMFIAGEPLRSVDPSLPVRAHNDYLEFVLEGGVPAIGILMAYAIAIMTLLVRALRVAASRDRPALTFSAATFVVMAFHSLVDYPLRSMALTFLGAAASGVLIGIVRDAAGAAANDRNVRSGI